MLQYNNVVIQKSQYMILIFVHYVDDLVLDLDLIIFYFLVFHVFFLHLKNVNAPRFTETKGKVTQKNYFSIYLKQLHVYIIFIKFFFFYQFFSSRGGSGPEVHPLGCATDVHAAQSHLRILSKYVKT